MTKMCTDIMTEFSVCNDIFPPVIQWNRQEGNFFVLSQIEHYNVIRISFERGEGAEGEGIYL